ncbi:hypothetical protein L202_01253 [Cryptococcus amylolentus CBS 6039]|uniref:tRNA (adenine(58)-N(1))-methyltransferase non-catalytic subunit TRM6 n=1 Tax=Cryptococcus amylolentus CBS 6039 TaxID=1295533 RepID=A0A1E3I3C7_9TREE|nr:hypothetical protein L202_01253 [Cryptococcus amylolentus CBS 6039]ODN83027.1 hypothetical protein L202_01253 [Cryptococcus amylolentus CBS 6039]
MADTAAATDVVMHEHTAPAPAPAEGSKRTNTHTAPASDEPQEPLSEVMFRRVTRIKEGDNVMLRLPSDLVKSIVVDNQTLVQLGKYGSFPATELIGLHYDITYEIIPGSGSKAGTPAVDEPVAEEPAAAEGSEKKKGKKEKKKVWKGKEVVVPRSNPGWSNILRPMKPARLADVIVDDVAETNELIEDLPEDSKGMLTQEEILELRAQGLTGDQIIEAQQARHESFKLKTDFSKEKWRRRKEKKFYQTICPLAPTIPNLLYHYTSRSANTILYLRDDTLAQMLTMANIRPGGRYIVVDDTGGLVTAAILERMGCEGRILLMTDNDSPPSWGVLQTMNFSRRELEAVKWLNWLQAEESYERSAAPSADEPEPTNVQKAGVKQRRRAAQIAELNNTRNELHLGGWDGLIVASNLSPLSVVPRLTPYLLGSSPLVVYSPYQQVLADLLSWSKKDPSYLNDTLSESWERTYQVLPGRTHPMMVTSATGGYIWSAIRVHPSAFQPESHQRFKRRKNNKAKAAEPTETESAGIIETKDEDDAELALEELVNE